MYLHAPCRSPFKGRSLRKNYNKEKPIKWGYTDYAMAESTTGYVNRFHPYQGRDQDKGDITSLAEFAIRAVVRERYFRKGYMIAWDNWFNCWPVLMFCQENGIHHVGTWRKGRKGLPVFSNTKQPRGTCQVLKHNAQNLWFIIWHDNKPVRMVANFPFHMGWCRRTDRKNAKGSGRHEKIKVSQPSLIATYNISKSGVDVRDQHVSYIRPKFRSRRNMRAYLIDLILTAVGCSRVIDNKLRVKRLPAKPERPIKEFVEVLIIKLVQPFLDRVNKKVVALCELCTDSHAASEHCKNCAKNMCESLAKTHAQQTSYNGHKLGPVVEEF